ncbi:DinB family protein [compost metagenome]
MHTLQSTFKQEVEAFINTWEVSMESRVLYDPQPDGSIATDTWGEVVRHVIAHEIHHIGQLSIWAREVGKPPISANVIGRGLTNCSKI